MDLIGLGFFFTDALFYLIFRLTLHSNQTSSDYRKKSAAPGWCNFDLEATVMPEEVKGNREAPEAEYEIEHVYGYRAADCQ